MNKIIFRLIFSFGVVILLSGCFEIEPDGFTSIDYFKDDSKNRILTYEYDEKFTGMNEDKIFQKAKNHISSGELTAMFFYPKGSRMPKNYEITQAKSVNQAYDILFSSSYKNWRYVFTKYKGRGGNFVVDCQIKDTGSANCKNWTKGKVF